MTLGFIGIGHIASAVVTGLCTSPHWSEPVLLSPCNAARSRALAERFPSVRVAVDNQAAIDGSDRLFLALRPQIAAEVLGGLRIRSDQPIVSLMAMVPEAALRRLSKSAAAIVRAVPLPSAARHQGPIALWPAEPASEALLGRIGRVVVVESEAALHALWAATGLVATFYGLADGVAGWLQQRGVAPANATAYVAALIQTIDDALDCPGATGFADLAKAASTRGGLNEQAARELAAAGWFAAIDDRLDHLLRRLEGEIEPPSTT